MSVENSISTPMNHLDNESVSSTSTLKTAPHFHEIKNNLNQSPNRDETEARYRVGDLSSSSFSNSIQSALYPLLYSAILEHLNSQLESELTSPLDSLYEDENTQNPDLFVELMLIQISNLFTPFADQHPEQNESATLDQFLNIISEGINNGISNTKEILDNNYSLDSTINSQIEQINDKLYEGLEQYCYTFGYCENSTPEGNEALYSENDSEYFLDDDLLDKLRM